MAEQSRPSRVEKVLVTGAGVSGLTTALELARVRENGKPRYTVQVVAERPADQTVSVIAGALGSFLPQCAASTATSCRSCGPSAV